MNEKLFRTALRYIEKGYSLEQLSYGDDLFSSTPEDKELCMEYYYTIQEQGTNWAYEELETLNK